MPVALQAGNVQDAVLSGPIILALSVAALAGLVSFFSPCVLPLVPVYLGYVSGLAEPPSQEGKSGIGTSVRPRTARVVLGTALFVAGFSVVFTSYGAAFGQLGRLLVERQEVLVRVSGVITVFMGLVFLGAFTRIPLLASTYKPAVKPQVGLVGAPLLGGLFAVGWTPCIGPTLAAVLTLSTTSATAGRGALLTFTYSLGLGLPFLFAAVSFGRSARSFEWLRRHLSLVSRTGGVFLVLIGLAQISGAWTMVLASLQGFIGGWQTPL